MAHFAVFVAMCVLVPLVVYALFAIGAYFGIQWYVTAVSILLVGRVIIGELER